MTCYKHINILNGLKHLAILSEQACTVKPRLFGPRLSGCSNIRTHHNAIYTFK